MSADTKDDVKVPWWGHLLYWGSLMLIVWIGATISELTGCGQGHPTDEPAAITSLATPDSE